MCFKLRMAACCLVLLGGSLAWGQNTVRVVVNARGDVTVFGTPNDDTIFIQSAESVNELFGGGVLEALEAAPDALIIWPFLFSASTTTFEFEGEESTFLLLPRTSSSSSIRVNSGNGDDVVFVDADLKSVSLNLGRGDDTGAIGTEGSPSNISTNIVIDTGPDSDRVVIREVIAGGNVRVNLGAGGLPLLPAEDFDPSNLLAGSSDGCMIESCSMLGSLTVNQTSGNSINFLELSSVESNTRVTLGTGNDGFLAREIDLGNLYVNLGPGEEPSNQEDIQAAMLDGINNTVDGSLTMIGGAYRDVLAGQEVFISGNVNLNAGSGDDQCGFVESTLAGNVVINSGAGDDELLLVSCDLDGDVRLNSSIGDDSVKFFDADTTDRGNWVINTGSGDDTLNIDGQSDLQTRLFSANLGSGDDEFVIFIDVDTQIGDPRATGSVGFDTFLSDFDPVNLTSFEDITNE